MRPIDFCIQEVDKQGDEGKLLSYIKMIQAFRFVSNLGDNGADKGLPRYVSIDDIRALNEYLNGQLEFRRVPVTFANGSFGCQPQAIGRQITFLLLYQDTMTPEDFYYAFEEIHPFIDGNGRAGAILYNVHKGTMRDPIAPPEFIHR